MVRRESVLKVGGYDAAISSCDDFDLWLRLAARGCSFGIVGSVVYRWRSHPNQVTGDLELRHSQHIKVLEKLLASGTYPWEVRDAAHRGFARTYKMRGDYAFAEGNTKKARSYYRQAMRYWPRPAQRLSWAFTFLGSVGRRGARLLNRGSDIF